MFEPCENAVRRACAAVVRRIRDATGRFRAEPAVPDARKAVLNARLAQTGKPLLL